MNFELSSLKNNLSQVRTWFYGSRTEIDNLECLIMDERKDKAKLVRTIYFDLHVKFMLARMERQNSLLGIQNETGVQQVYNGNGSYIGWVLSITDRKKYIKIRLFKNYYLKILLLALNLFPVNCKNNKQKKSWNNISLIFIYYN